MKEKIIGIYAASMGENAFGVGKTYLEFINQFGVPRILTPDNMFDESIDLLLLQGGLDVAPASYGEIPGYYTSNTDVFKQHVMDKCLPNYVYAKTPVFGICLGFQQLAVFFGCKLTQNLPYHPYSEPRSKKAHDMFVDLNLTKDFYWGDIPYSKKFDNNKIEVNSLHHQALLREGMNPGGDPNQSAFLPIAYAKNEEYSEESNGKEIIEVILHKELPIGGVQFHPEERYTPFVTDFVEYLLSMK